MFETTQAFGRIITQSQAWDELTDTVNFFDLVDKVRSEINNDEPFAAEKEALQIFTAEGIDSFEGYEIRSDGMVEVDS